MKKVFTIIYSTIISLVYIGALTFFAWNVISEYNHGVLRAQKRFDTVAVNITKIPDYKGPQSADYPSEITKAVGSEYDFAYINVLLNGKPVYTYPAGSTFTETSSKLIKNHEKAVKIGNDNIYIQASVYVLRPVSIFNYARLAFIIILSATILTVILIMITGFAPQSSDEADEKPMRVNPKKIKVEYVEPENDDYTSCEPDNLNLMKEPDVSENAVFEEGSFDSKPYSDESAAPETKETVEIAEKTEVAEKPVEKLPVKPLKKDEENEMDLPSPNKFTEYNSETENESLPGEEAKPMQMKENNPSGLFSPVTGFGWQSYLEARLTNELKRATATETDLSLFIIKIPALLNCSDENLKEICKVIEDKFQFRDLIFEFSDDCFSAIRINMSVDDAIIFADKIISELKVILPLDAKECFIGISSRSIRMVDTRTILHEASEALKHAVQSETAPVIAFRADAAKYRKYVELD